MPTHRILRRLVLPALLLLAGSCDSPSTVTPPPPPPPPEPPAEPAQVAWLRANARPIRSLSVADRDFSDLQPLKAAIGNSRVVMLGEATHGDAPHFLAKARLIAFLHQEMGFDVLAWESGLWDVGQVWRQVQAGAPVLPASRRGIFGIWMGAEEVLPTMDYVASTLGTARPLELAGFDMQFTGNLADDSMHILTERFAVRIGSAVVNDPEWPAARETLRQAASGLHYTTKPDEAEKARLLRLLAALRADAAARPPADREALFWTQVLESTAAYAQAVWALPVGQYGMGTPRDVQMGRNLVWLANVWYPGRKIIVWAANVHIARNVVDLRTISDLPYPTGTNPLMGGETYRVLGADMYSIGFTAGIGSWGRWGLPSTLLAAPMDGSLEAYLRQAGMQNAFVDLRAPAAGGEWLKSMWARPFGYMYLRGDWTRVLDGMIYTADMVPSTPASR
jgi:erythromycin esterase